MNFVVKTSLGILFLLILVNADVEESNIGFNEYCQALKCKPTEVCRSYIKCDASNQDDLSKCVYCALKDDLNQNTVSKTLIASSISEQQQQPLAPRLLARSGGKKLLADNRGFTRSSTAKSTTVKSINKTSDEPSYDDYYEYDEDETSDKNEFGEEDEYLDDYAEPIDSVIKGSEPIRKLGVCPKVVEAVGKCDSSKISQSDCRFDTDCPGDHKCCEAACGKRVCRSPMTTSVSVCPLSFTCTLNCRLGYRTDSNGCLLCECQSCPSMDQCNKNCPSGYLKDLFGCDICECSEQCPPFSCGILCPPDIGFAKSSDGCPLCQCATTKTKPTEYTSSCQDDVHCPPGFRCLNDARNVPMCQAVPEVIAPPASTKECPLYKCVSDCGPNGYKLDGDGCKTCECITKVVKPKPKVECSRVMCRMLCIHGFKRDENGCEICKCNDSPQPCPQLTCDNQCSNGYQKDYSGCQTCSCNDEPKVIDGCTPMNCALDCKYGFERDASDCELCSCNRCPLYTCRMFCMYGFKKNQDGCDVCECDWSPVAENIQCSERIPCEGNRVCNMNLQLCEVVSADKVNWFLYDFELKTQLFQDPEFVKTFKSGLIYNIALKYDLEPTQITVSSIEQGGLTSFQIMPFYMENPDDFQKKMDQIDIDLNSHEFRSVIPSVANQINKNTNKPSDSKWNRYAHKHPRIVIYFAAVLIGIVALIFAAILLVVFRRQAKYPIRSESKSPIFDSSYQQAPTDDEHYHAVRAPDGTAYVVVESEDVNAPNDKRVLV